MYMRPVCWLCPDAWLTGPSKNGADINRLGCSHVFVYTVRPQSSTTRAMDSLCTANSHTIHLCLIQIHLLIQYIVIEIHQSLGTTMKKCILFSTVFPHHLNDIFKCFSYAFIFVISSLIAALYLCPLFTHLINSLWERRRIVKL